MSSRKPTQQVVVYLDLHMPSLPTRINEKDQKRNHSHLTRIYMILGVSVSIRGQTIIETISNDLLTLNRAPDRTLNLILLFAVS